MLLKIHKAALITSLQIFWLPAQWAALQLRLRLIYQYFRYCTTQNLGFFLVISNSETFGALESENFKLDLLRQSWDSIYKCNKVNQCYTRFLHIFNKVSNIHAPLKKAKRKHKAYKPWITSGLKKSMQVRNKLYKKWHTLNDGLLLEIMFKSNYKLWFINKYEIYGNKITIINKIYRYWIYYDILNKSDNTKKVWDNINLLINKKWPSSHIDKLQVDNKNDTNNH